MTMTESPPIADWAPPQQPVIVQGAQPSNRRGIKVLALLAVLALAASAFIVASLAVFTDTETDDNSFATGTIDISTSPATTAFSVTAMAPGDEVVTPITVNNDGSLDLRYAVTSVTTSGDQTLADQLVLTVSSVANAAHCTVAAWDDGTATGGTVISGTAGILSAATPGRQVIGDSAQGSQTGDRTLVGTTGTEILCFHATLPLSSGNSFQSQSVTADFTFFAEQTRNNP